MKADATPQADSELFPDLYSPAPPPSEMEAMGGKMTQIGPGIWVSGLPEFETPSHILCRLVPLATPGTYALDPEPYPGYVRFQEHIGRKLGLIGLSDTTMRRLLACGFVDSARPSIGMILINIESLLAHLKRTANDTSKESSWWTPERRALWRSVIESNCNLEDGY